MTEASRKRVVVSGAAGRMGSEVVRMVIEDSALELVGGADPTLKAGDELPAAARLKTDVPVFPGLDELLDRVDAEVVVDFTTPHAVMGNIEVALSRGVHAVVGTTGLTAEDIQTVETWAGSSQANAVIAPNFAIGAVLMMRFAALAAPYFEEAEIVEKHHEKKLDAPSGTAVRTAEMIAAARKKGGMEDSGAGQEDEDFIEKIPGSRGGEHEQVRIHSLRLPGLVAHQDVVFGTEGQTLTISHDSTHRSSFMPGVRMAIERVDEVDGVVHGLDQLLFDDE